MTEQFGEHFAPPEEVRNMNTEICLDDNIIGGAGLPLLSDGKNMCVCNDDSHSLVIGGSGSKKNRLIVFPLIHLLAKRGENMLISDPKGETLSRTGNFLKQHGYNIRILDYRHLGKKGDFYNPLTYGYRLYKSGHQDEAQEVFADFVNVISAPQKKSTNDIFWAESASSLAVGILNLIAECGSEDEVNVATFARMCSIDNIENLEKLADMLPPNSVAGINLKGIRTAPERTKMSIYVVLFAMVSMFMNQNNLIKAMSSSTFELDELAKPKTALFIITPDEKDTFNFAVSMIVKQAYQILIAKAQENDDLKLGTRVNFILDEFPNIPRIPDFISMISAGRSRNIRFFLVAQSLHQLQSKYGISETQTIIGNCSNIVYLHSRELPLLDMLSRMCGQRYLFDGSAIPLITPAQLQRLSKEKGEALIFCGRLHPYVTCLPDIDRYDSFKGYPPMEPPAAEPKQVKLLSLKRLIKDIDIGIRQMPFTGAAAEKPSRTERDELYSTMYHELVNEISRIFSDFVMLESYDDDEEQNKRLDYKAIYKSLFGRVGNLFNQYCYFELEESLDDNVESSGDADSNDDNG